MKNGLDEILSLIRRVDEAFRPNQDKSDFSSVQSYARNKYGDFNDKPSLDIFDTGNFNMFKKLKMFMDDILGTKIYLTYSRLSKDLNKIETVDSDDDANDLLKKSSILKSIQHTLSTNRRCNLLGDVFEGLLFKVPDMGRKADLSCGIEIKTTSPTSRVLTLFTTGTKKISDITYEISKFIDECGIVSPSIEVYFGKTFFKRYDDDGQIEFDFNKENSVEREIGVLKDNYDNSLAAIFYLSIMPTENSLMYELFVRNSDKSVKTSLCSFSIPYDSINLTFDDKLKNVFHVVGKVEKDSSGTYAMFTNYESMILKEGLSIQRLITSGVLKPIVNASLKSDDVIKRNELEKNTKKTQDNDSLNIDFNKEEVNEDDGNRFYGYDLRFGNIKTDIELKTVFKVKGVSFKLNLNDLGKMYDIEKK